MKPPSLKNQKGVAMMMALVTFLVLSVLVGELAYETGVYNSVVWRQVDQLRTRLLARSGLRLALLQLRAAEKAKEKAKSLGLGDGSGLTDQIWKTPLILPPPAPPGLGQNESQALEAFGKALGLEGSVAVNITGENSRINLNQLVWVGEQPQTPAAPGSPGTPAPVPTNPTAPTAEKKKELLAASRKAITEIVDQLINNKRQEDNEFRDRYGTLSAEALVGHLAAWMSPEVTEDGDNRPEDEYYSRLEPYPYAIKNAPMVTESELFMVKGFDDTLARLIADNFTTQPTGGLDVNKASKVLLQALIPELGDYELERILQRRTDDSQGGPFKSADDFWNFLNSLGNYEDAKKRLGEQGIKILEKESSYRVIVTAKSGSASRTWMALVGPKPPTVDPQTPQPGQPAPPTQPPVDLSKPADELEKEAEEKKNQKNDKNSLNIIYLKAD